MKNSRMRRTSPFRKSSLTDIEMEEILGERCKLVIDAIKKRADVRIEIE